MAFLADLREVFPLIIRADAVVVRERDGRRGEVPPLAFRPDGEHPLAEADVEAVFLADCREILQAAVHADVRDALRRTVALADVERILAAVIDDTVFLDELRQAVPRLHDLHLRCRADAAVRCYEERGTIVLFPVYETVCEFLVHSYSPYSFVMPSVMLFRSFIFRLTFSGTLITRRTTM